MPERSMTARCTVPSRSTGWTVARPPLRRPSGERAASTMTTSLSAIVPTVISFVDPRPGRPPRRGSSQGSYRCPSRAGPGCHDLTMGRRIVWAGVAGVMFLAACTSGASHAAPTTTINADIDVDRRRGARPHDPVDERRQPRDHGADGHDDDGVSESRRLDGTVPAAAVDGVVAAHERHRDGRRMRRPCHLRFCRQERRDAGCERWLPHRPVRQRSERRAGSPCAAAHSWSCIVRRQPATISSRAGPPIPGPTRIDPSGVRHVREVVETGDFEGVVTWVVGLDTKRPFAVVPETIPPGVSTITPRDLITRRSRG